MCVVCVRRREIGSHSYHSHSYLRNTKTGVGFDGQVSVMNASKSCPCYRCIHPKPASLAATGSCSNNGVMGPVVGIVGSMMALEAIKLLGKVGEALCGRLCVVDSWGSRFRNMRLPSRQSKTCLCVEVTEHSRWLTRRHFV